jgi:hypothetical protein
MDDWSDGDLADVKSCPPAARAMAEGRCTVERAVATIACAQSCEVRQLKSGDYGRQPAFGVDSGGWPGGDGYL